MAYVFLAPWLLGLFLLTIGPMLVSLYLSFTDYQILSAPEWLGWANYRRMFTADPRYLKSLAVTLQYVFVSVPLKLSLALLLAMALRRGLRGLDLYRALFYLPSLLGGSVAIAILWQQVFGLRGVVNAALDVVGIDGRNWVANPSTALWTLIALAVWQFGSPMVIFLAGLRAIPGELYEAASVDGAGRWAQFRIITLPLLSPVILFNLVMQTITSFQAFTPAFIVSGGTGGPADSTLFYTLYLYRQGFGAFNMGYASAMAWVLLLIIAAFTALMFGLSKRWVFYLGDN